jgi:probable rRNA maturation factor
MPHFPSSDSPSILVSVENEQKDLTLSNMLKDQVSAIVQQVLLLEEVEYHEVSLYFTDKETISQLHADFFDDPTPTDCISFPMDDSDEQGYRVLGEVFVCPAVAIEYAQSHSIDPYEETTLYVVHGLLHLLGYDDIEESDRLEMRAAEQKHIDHLKQLNLLLKSA